MWNPFKKAAQRAHKEDMPAVAPSPAPDADAARVQRLMDMISAADTGAQLVSFLKTSGIEVRFLDTIPQGADTLGTCVLNTLTIEEQSPYRFKLKKPVINILRSATDAQAATALLHEGRHAMQAENGLHPLTRYLSREDMKSCIRLIEADASSFTLLSAIKVFLANGDSSIIEAAIRSQADDECVAKLVTLAGKYGPGALDDPMAQHVLFDAWFEAKDIVARYDSSTDAQWAAVDATVRACFGFPPVPSPLKKEDIIGLGLLTHAENYLMLAGMSDPAAAAGLGAQKAAATATPKPPVL